MFTYAEGQSHGTYDLCDAVYSAFVLPDVIPTAIVEVSGHALGLGTVERYSPHVHH